MQDSQIPLSRPPAGQRWTLIGQVLRFQVKLLVDGLRDLFMSPISLVAALLGLLVHPRDPGRLFDEVLQFGRKTEDWINLFGRRQPDPGIDELFRRLEDQLESQYNEGGVTRRAKNTVDASLNGLHRALRRLTSERAGQGGPTAENTSSDETAQPADNRCDQ